MQKFVALYDAHFGYERRNGHKVALHDEKAISVATQFIADFKPDHTILGGDILDCGCISHHNHGKPGATEGFRLLADAIECRGEIIGPVEEATKKSLTYIVGNHEAWCEDLVEQIPALEGIVDVASLLKLGSKWKVVPQGDIHKLGKLVFMHGDQVKGGEHSAKWATVAYEANVRFGHHHTYQTYTKTSAIQGNGHTGICVPCLCRKGPKYGGGSPNRWVQGFLYGYIHDDGMFNDYVPVITNGKAVIEGKMYKG